MIKIKSLKYLWVKNNNDDNTIEDGEIKIVALNNDYGLTAYEIEQIIKFTLSIAPANFSNTAVTAEATAPTTEVEKNTAIAKRIYGTFTWNFETSSFEGI